MHRISNRKPLTWQVRLLFPARNPLEKSPRLNSSNWLSLFGSVPLCRFALEKGFDRHFPIRYDLLEEACQSQAPNIELMSFHRNEGNDR